MTCLNNNNNHELKLLFLCIPYLSIQSEDEATYVDMVPKASHVMAEYSTHPSLSFLIERNRIMKQEIDILV